MTLFQRLQEKLEELQAKEDAKNAAAGNLGTSPLSKKQARLGSTGKAPPPDKAPPRVSTQSLMSAKTQIRLLKAVSNKTPYLSIYTYAHII